MKLLIDSSYFFPFIGIGVKDSYNSFIKDIQVNREINLFYCSITLFELSAKSSKLIKNKSLNSKEVIEGIISLRDWEIFTLADPWASEVQKLAFRFRMNHADYIDCLILASAVVYSEIFVTEDQLLKKLIKSTWNEDILKVNENFSCLTAVEIMKRYKNK